MISSPAHLALFTLILATLSSASVCLAAGGYLRRVRIERPKIGTFNGRDTVFLFAVLSPDSGPLHAHSGGAKWASLAP